MSRMHKVGRGRIRGFSPQSGLKKASLICAAGCALALFNGVLLRDSGEGELRAAFVPPRLNSTSISTFDEEETGLIYPKKESSPTKAKSATTAKKREKAKIKVAKSRKSRWKERIQSLKAELEEKEQRVTELEKALEKRESTVQQLAQRLNLFQNELQNSHQQTEERALQEKILASLLQKQETELCSLRGKWEAEDERCAKLSSEVEERKRYLDEASNKLQEKGKQLHQLALQVRTLTDEREKLQERLEELDAINKRLVSKVKRCKIAQQEEGALSSLNAEGESEDFFTPSKGPPSGGLPAASAMTFEEELLAALSSRKIALKTPPQPGPSFLKRTSAVRKSLRQTAWAPPHRSSLYIPQFANRLEKGERSSASQLQLSLSALFLAQKDVRVKEKRGYSKMDAEDTDASMERLLDSRPLAMPPAET